MWTGQLLLEEEEEDRRKRKSTKARNESKTTPAAAEATAEAVVKTAALLEEVEQWLPAHQRMQSVRQSMEMRERQARIVEANNRRVLGEDGGCTFQRSAGARPLQQHICQLYESGRQSH